ncbi:hypothetical protein BJV77DRAFT_1153178 [Russula vinacea]|nr:hypothetical protein BJV77DRAFT_1153178 [Russula vinacea]
MNAERRTKKPNLALVVSIRGKGGARMARGHPFYRWHKLSLACLMASATLQRRPRGQIAVVVVSFDIPIRATFLSRYCVTARSGPPPRFTLCLSNDLHPYPPPQVPHGADMRHIKARSGLHFGLSVPAKAPPSMWRFCHRSRARRNTKQDKLKGGGGSTCPSVTVNP